MGGALSQAPASLPQAAVLLGLFTGPFHFLPALCETWGKGSAFIIS